MDLLTTKQAAERLGRSESTLYRWLRQRDPDVLAAVHRKPGAWLRWDADKLARINVPANVGVRSDG